MFQSSDLFVVFIVPQRFTLVNSATGLYLKDFDYLGSFACTVDVSSCLFPIENARVIVLLVLMSMLVMSIRYTALHFKLPSHSDHCAHRSNYKNLRTSKLTHWYL